MLRPIGDIAFEKTGKRPSPATQWRWLRRGCRGVVLNGSFIGGRWLTSEANFDAFIQGQTQKQLGESDSPDESAILAEYGL